MNVKDLNPIAIAYTVGACAVGKLLVARSSRGIVALLLGDDQEALAVELFERFSQARISRSDDALAQLLADVTSFVENPRQTFDLPLDRQGTTFQLKVWDSIATIPVGCTASYSEIATDIGLPRAARAVARACAANSLAVIIPCHRVIRSDGSVAGYRYGVERRTALLKRERLET